MAVIYLRSTDGSDSDDGSTWALAKATLAAALTAAGAGGTVYVSQAHAETQASSMTLASPGTAGAITNVICVNDSAAPPTTQTTGASVTTTGTSAITFTGFAYIYGLTFNVATGSTGTSCNFAYSSGNPTHIILDTCTVKIVSTSTSTTINVGYGSSGLRDQGAELRNTTVKFGNASQKIQVYGRLAWEAGGVDNTGSSPTYLFSGGNGHSGQVTVNSVDLSALGSSSNLVYVSGNGTSRFNFNSCTLGASVGVVSGAVPGQDGPLVLLDNCDSGDTNYRMEHYKYQGSIKTETSKIRSSGASDGTTAISWNMTTLAGAAFVSPLESPPITIWNENTGSSKTVTVEIAQDNAGTALNDDEIWIEVEYLGTSGYPISTVSSDRKTNILSSAAAQTTSSVTWNNMTTPTKQKLEVTFTPQEKGPFAARVMLAKASTTVYVDPIVTVS